MEYDYYMNKYGGIFRKGREDDSEIYYCHIVEGEIVWISLGSKIFTDAVRMISDEDAFLEML
tara:strand:+ start:856 stop:1041 length:186 start_codon:yes stop_codon:yes gene_type:complete